MLIDTHAHLYWDSYKRSLPSGEVKDDLDEVIQRSLDAGVTTIINVGVDVEKSEIALTQAQGQLEQIPKNFTIYSTIGIHPHEALRLSFDKLRIAQGKLFEEIEELEQIYYGNPKKVVAVGECGLDFAFEGLEGVMIKTKQKQLFQAQIDLAKKLNLPLIVHCRDDRSQNPQNSEAWDEVLEMIGNHPAILHCYSGLSPTTNYILQATNLLVSFAGTITYPKNEYLRAAAKILPLEKICLETDCPFLPPQSKRGQRNEPANVLEIAQLVADIKDVSLKEVANQTTLNVKRMLIGSRHSSE